MGKLRILLALIILGTVGLSALTLLLPKPADAEISIYYSPIATSVVLVDVLFALGSAVLFFLALRNFKPELKPAYRLMAFSTIAVGLLLTIFPFIEYYGLWDILFFNIASYAQYLVGAPLMYLGVRMFYKRLGLGGWASSLGIVAAVIAVLSLVHAFLPHFDVWPDFSEMGYDFFQIITILPLVLYAVTAYMALRVRLRTGRDYKSAFTWLTVGLALYVFNTAGIVVLETVGYENWYFDNRIYTYPAILGDLSLVFAGYCFASIGRKVAAGVKEGGGKVTSMAIITHVAQMASDQTKIEADLEVLREVSATVSPDRPLTSDQQSRLRGAYLHIEQHLVSDDALRNFDKAKLRDDVSSYFGLDKNAGGTFWSSL